MSEIESLKTRLKNDPNMSKKFHADFLDLLKRHGVDVSNTEVRSQLGLDKVHPHQFSIGPAASSVVVTITQ